MMMQYVRDNKRQPKGILIAFVICNKLCIGYSLCSPKDKFDRDFGIGIAKDRATAEARSGRVLKNIPHSIIPDLIKFAERCRKYFKEYHLPNWVVWECSKYDHNFFSYNYFPKIGRNFFNKSDLCYVRIKQANQTILR